VDSDLKKSLEIIKARAQRLRSGKTGGHPDGDSEDSSESASPRTHRTRGQSGVRAKGPEQTSPAADPLAAYKTGEPKRLEQIQPGEVRETDGHTFYLIRTGGIEVDPHCPSESEVFARLDAWPRQVDSKPFGVTPRKRLTRRALRPTGYQSGGKIPFAQETICFLDIETTGLSPNTYVFLCGIMLFADGEFVVEQAFARDYAEEAGLLAYIGAALSRFETVVTYNGVKFDLPFIKTRMAVNRIPVFKPFSSVDLLYTARRVFKGKLPNCRLGTVERHLRGLEREGDIPGKHIPAAYHDYVHSGDGRAMKNVLYHNRMDLFTMAVFINRLAANETK
jgi:uncharacterized protein YprB with RNaseH-like and TPR domain